MSDVQDLQLGRKYANAHWPLRHCIYYLGDIGRAGSPYLFGRYNPNHVVLTPLKYTRPMLEQLEARDDRLPLSQFLLQYRAVREEVVR